MLKIRFFNLPSHSYNSISHLQHLRFLILLSDNRQWVVWANDDDDDDYKKSIEKKVYINSPTQFIHFVGVVIIIVTRFILNMYTKHIYFVFSPFILITHVYP